MVQVHSLHSSAAVLVSPGEHSPHGSVVHCHPPLSSHSQVLHPSSAALVAPGSQAHGSSPQSQIASVLQKQSLQPSFVVFVSPGTHSPQVLAVHCHSPVVSQAQVLHPSPASLVSPGSQVPTAQASPRHFQVLSARQIHSSQEHAAQASSAEEVVPGAQLAEHAAPMVFQVLSARQMHSSAPQAVQASSPAKEEPGEQDEETSTLEEPLSVEGEVDPPHATLKLSRRDRRSVITPKLTVDRFPKTVDREVSITRTIKPRSALLRT